MKKSSSFFSQTQDVSAQDSVFSVFEDSEASENEELQKRDGFRDEQYFIIPTEAFVHYAAHPLIKPMYLTDVGYFPNAQDHYREREEGIEEYILLYCIHGQGVVEINHACFPLASNEIICIPKHTRHRYYADEEAPWSIFWVHFKGENTLYFPFEPIHVIKMTSQHAQNRLTFLFDLLFRVLARNYTLGNFIYISQVLQMILAEVYYREKSDDVSLPNKHVTQIIRYMYNHIEHSLTLEDLSQRFNLSKSYLNAIFRSCTQRTPIDFFIHLKAQEACKLLKSTDLSIGEIARQLGYVDPYYFSRIFKKAVGIAPSVYKSAEYLPCALPAEIRHPSNEENQ